MNTCIKYRRIGQRASHGLIVVERLRRVLDRFELVVYISFMVSAGRGTSDLHVWSQKYLPHVLSRKPIS